MNFIILIVYAINIFVFSVGLSFISFFYKAKNWNDVIKNFYEYSPIALFIFFLCFIFVFLKLCCNKGEFYTKILGIMVSFGIVVISFFISFETLDDNFWLSSLGLCNFCSTLLLLSFSLFNTFNLYLNINGLKDSISNIYYFKKEVKNEC